MSKAVMQQALDFCHYAWKTIHMDEWAFEKLEETIEALEQELARKQTPDELLRQSEREGWRYSKELEHEIKRLNAELAKPEKTCCCDDPNVPEVNNHD